MFSAERWKGRPTRVPLRNGTTATVPRSRWCFRRESSQVSSRGGSARLCMWCLRRMGRVCLKLILPACWVRGFCRRLRNGRCTCFFYFESVLVCSAVHMSVAASRENANSRLCIACTEKHATSNFHALHVLSCAIDTPSNTNVNVNDFYAPDLVAFPRFRPSGLRTLPGVSSLWEWWPLTWRSRRPALSVWRCLNRPTA